MSWNSRALGLVCQKAHDRMRDVEGLLPQEAFDELLKFLFYKEFVEARVEEGALRKKRVFHESPAAIRESFSTMLASHAPWARNFWVDGRFHIADSTLLDLQRLFANVRLSDSSIDVGSTALWTFLSPDVRRGLGIFTTPEDVVRTMIEIVEPKSSDVVLDPACGTGTFLLETVRYLLKNRPRGRQVTVYGVDKNPRMLLLANLNLGRRSQFLFRKACVDSLRELGQAKAAPLGLSPNSVDVILTNPPFGVTVTRDTGVLGLFDTGGTNLSQERDKVPSEVLFTELCLRLLKPGGRLGIVLPRSVITNEGLGEQRHMIDQLGSLTHLIGLPPETFVSTGTQTTTVVAFFRKYPLEYHRKAVSVQVCHVTNVGFDTTGRLRQGNQLPALATKLAEDNPRGEPTVITYSDIAPTESLQRAADLLFRRNGCRTGKTLRDFVELANVGRTPGRSAYTNKGIFILKVGNLTGRGIDWEPRDRNFVSNAEGTRRAKYNKLTVRKGDILLTSSAHAARYIAKKVDIVAHIPEEFGGVTFVGEMIRLRPARGVNPYVLLAALRHPRVREDLQACVRGQTAHLNATDLLAVTVPCDLLSPDRTFIEAAELLRMEADFAFQLNLLNARISKLLDSTDTPTV